GMVVGIWLAVLVCQRIDDFKLAIPFGSLVFLLVAAGIVGVLAAVLPARRGGGARGGPGAGGGGGGRGGGGRGRTVCAGGWRRRGRAGGGRHSAGRVGQESPTSPVSGPSSRADR